VVLSATLFRTRADRIARLEAAKIPDDVDSLDAAPAVAH